MPEKRADSDATAASLVELDESSVDDARAGALVPAITKSFKTSVLSIAIFYALLVQTAPVGLSLWLAVRVVVSVLCLGALRRIRIHEASAADQIRSLAFVVGVSGITWGLLPLFAHPESTQWRAVLVLWIFGNQSVMTAVCSAAKPVFAAAVGSVTVVSASAMALNGKSFDVVLAFLLILGGLYSASIFSAMNGATTNALEGRLIAQHLAQSLSSRQEALSVANERLERLANEDVLTSAPNRRGFIEAITADGVHVESAGWVGVIDIDHFKAINDTYGHLAGDSVLVECTRRWSATLPEGAVLGRMGGDEFAIALPGCPEEAALKFGSWLVEACSSPVETESGSVVHVSCSIGLTQAEAGESLSSVLARADAALYASKQSGRSSVSSGRRTDVPGERRSIRSRPLPRPTAA